MMKGLHDDIDAVLAPVPGFLVSPAAHGTAWLLMEQAEGDLEGGYSGEGHVEQSLHRDTLSVM